MARFIDRLLASPQVDALTRAVLGTTTVIVGDNVSDYFYTGTGQEMWKPERDFPNVAPPYDSFFIEFRAPTHIYSDVMGRVEWKDGEMPCAWGVLFEAVDTQVAGEESSPGAQLQLLIATESLMEALKKYYWSFAPPVLEHVGGDPSRAYTLFNEEQRAVVDQVTSLFKQSALMRTGAWEQARNEMLARRGKSLDARWVVFAQMFTEFRFRSQRTLLSPWYWTLPVTAEGGILAASDSALFVSGPLGDVERDIRARARQTGGSPEQELWAYAAEIHPLFYASLLTLTFLHCGNVSRTRVEPPPREVSARAKRHGILPHRQMPYYVLGIEPIKNILRTEGHAEQQGLRRALHVCRGHFADYRQGAGLFGKHKGIYWFPQHLRGSLPTR